MRLVAVSATLPNIGDIASFLDAHEAYIFDSSFRPVPLSTHVVGLGFIGKNQFLFDKGLNRHIPDLIKRFSKGRPTIIFCHTKKQTEALATELVSSIGSTNDPMLLGLAQQTNLLSLQKCLKGGTAFHHAGMENENRKLVEQNFSKGLVKCLCATSTLAMGVNLPAHLVIIKGTSVWRGAGQGYQEIDTGTMLQMMGRAGRPGLDDSGTAVIMTDGKSKQRYERMSHGLEVVESMMLKQLTETLNTEISQRVITNVKEAIDWLKGTFFFIRVRKNTKHYGLERKKDAEIESYLMTQCMNSLRDLHERKIIDLDNGGSSVEPRKASHVMSRHMIPFEAMKAIVALPHDAGPLQILQTLSNMNGLHFPVRRSEKVRWAMLGYQHVFV
jgi:ATP-dependent DNA helicase HFM1/MER3